MAPLLRAAIFALAAGGAQVFAIALPQNQTPAVSPSHYAKHKHNYTTMSHTKSHTHSRTSSPATASATPAVKVRAQAFPSYPGSKRSNEGSDGYAPPWHAPTNWGVSPFSKRGTPGVGPDYAPPGDVPIGREASPPSTHNPNTCSDDPGTAGCKKLGTKRNTKHADDSEEGDALGEESAHVGAPKRDVKNARTVSTPEMDGAPSANGRNPVTKRDAKVTEKDREGDAMGTEYVHTGVPKRDVKAARAASTPEMNDAPPAYHEQPGSLGPNMGGTPSAGELNDAPPAFAPKARDDKEANFGGV